MSQSSASYIIVGAGVLGASTALHLITRQPSAQVTLIDRSLPCRSAASWDWSKVIRADYANITYMKLALEAMTLWRTDPLYSSFYHESGIIWVDDREHFTKGVLDNYNRLGSQTRAKLISTEEVKKLSGGLYNNADFGNTSQVLVNEDCGWVQASKALQSVIDTLVSAGVQCVEANIARLEFHHGSCTGARSQDGRIFSAQQIVLATGAETAKLVVESVDGRQEKVHVGDRLTAAAIYTGIATVSEEVAQGFRGGHIFLHAVGKCQGASFPINEKNEIKFARDVSFKNSIQHESGQTISMPPTGPEYNQWQVSPRMKQEISQVARGIYGKDFQMDRYRVCWDAITPTQDFLICPHPHVGKLYLATGGSFHAWKFLPTIGKYVVDMLEGCLDAELAAKWAWDKEGTGGAHESLVPFAELGDLMRDS